MFVADLATAASSSSLTLSDGVWGLLGIAVALLGKAYLVPFLVLAKRRKYAEWIAHIADEVTDDLSARYPDKKWIEFLDESVDTLMGICDIPKETAERAVMAATSRKST